MSDSPNQWGVTTEHAIELYRTMLTIRQFETKAGALFAAGELPGFIHLSIGQEAVAAGVCCVLDRMDQITTTHRGHGHCIAKGGQVVGMLAELYGRGGGYAKGRSGSMHIADSSVGILGANAIVAANLPMALGAAYSAQVRGDGRLAVAFLGEGAVAEGVFHETMNLAALWKLPIIFVCENNRYSELTPISVHLATERVVDFAAPYGIPAASVDGNDVLAVRAEALAAVDRARAGEGPTFLECETYRWRGHFEGDPGRYRPSDELAAWERRDPVATYRSRLVAEAGVLDDELRSVEQDIEKLVEAAAAEAKAMPLTPSEWVTSDVYRSDLIAGA